MVQFVLECKRVIYHSDLDETCFFNWLDNIDCISNVKGIGNSLMLEVESPPSDEGLRELLAILHRYKINKEQLSQFETEANRHWFARNKYAFWYKGVFKKETK